MHGKEGQKHKLKQKVTENLLETTSWAGDSAELNYLRPAMMRPPAETTRSKRQKSRETKQVLPSPTFNVDNQEIIPFLLEKRDIGGDGGCEMLLQCPNYFWPPRDCRRYLGEVTKGPCGERVY